MSHLSPGLISAYNSLTDKHLAGYFSNTRIRRHLQRAGLITRSGRIVPDKEYRHKLIQRAHQRHVRECLAQAIFHKVLELERVHQIEIKRKLEEFARRERVHKIKVECSKRYEEDIIRILSPRPPTGARGIRKQHSGPEGEQSESSESPGSSRPNTAPGKMQRPIRLKPLHSNSTTAPHRRSSPNRLHESSNEPPFSYTLHKESRRRYNTMDAPHGISPYCLPVINNFVTPVPPPPKRRERGSKLNPSGTLRGRRLRPTTASSVAEITEDPPMLRGSVHQSRVCVTMTYFGKTVHLSHDLTDLRDEVKVFQQHCGGENLCVYKGKLREGETFQFISRRHRGFPFSLTFFLNGLQVERLSSCCEFKHRRGSRLGGRHGHFGFCSVEGASPCYKCIIAMGLDKKPSPPPKRVKEDRGREESLLIPKIAPETRTETARSNTEDMETQVKKETAADEDKAKDDYEEDFEADDEGPAEDTEAKATKSLSPPPVTERKTEETGASETEDDCEKDEDIKSRSGSSLSGNDREESDAEDTKDPREEERAEQPKEVDEEETVAPPEEKEEPQPEETTTAEAESATPKDSDVANSAGESTEIDISDTSVPSGTEIKQSDDTSGEREVENTENESKQEEVQERAKSVQEKLAEAILKESQCSSEPELSDTSTDDTVESTHKGCEEENKDAATVKAVTSEEQQQTVEEETKHEEGVVAVAVATAVAATALDQGELSEQNEKEESATEPAEKSDAKEDEKVKDDKEDEKVAPGDKTTEENDKPEETEVSVEALPPVPGNEAAGDNKIEAQEDTAGKSTEAAEKKTENEENTAGESETNPQETSQGAKSSEKDESSVSEPNKGTDDTAEPGNTETEAMTVSETVEMKAGPSEEQEALSCEEEPKTVSQQGENEDRAAESRAEVTEETGDSTVEKTEGTSEDNVKDESKKDIQKVEVHAAEGSDDNKQQEKGDENSVDADDDKEKESEEGNEEEKQIKTDETTEGKDGKERKVQEQDQTEEDESKESKIDERMAKISNEEKSEKEEDQVANVKEEDGSREGEDRKSEEATIEKIAATATLTTAAANEMVKGCDEENKNEAENEKEEQTETEAKKSKATKNIENDEAAGKKAVTYPMVEAEDVDKVEKEGKSDETNRGEDKNEEEEAVEKVAVAVVVGTAAASATIAAADEEKQNVEQKDQTENKAKNIGNKESAETKVVTYVTVESEEKSEKAKEPQKMADADSDNVKKSEESEDLGDSDVANVALAAITTAEIVNSAPGAEVVTKKYGEGDDKGEIDAENGEISTVAETKPQEDQAECNVKDVEQTKEETKSEGATEEASTEAGEVNVESEEAAEKLGKEVAQDPVVESKATEDEASEKNQDHLTKNELELEKFEAEVKEESKSDEAKNSEEAKQDENANLSESKHENKDTKMSDGTEENVNEVLVSSTDQIQATTPTAVDSDNLPQHLERSMAPSDFNTESHPDPDEDGAAGENEDTEEASKPSEDGASVLLKPQTKSEQHTQPTEAEKTEESVAVVEETPEILAREDLVTNWVTMHQASKYFETFVEPLEDLKEVTPDAKESNSGVEATQHTEIQRAESPLKMSPNVQELMPKEDEAKADSKELQENRETNVENATTKTESEIVDKESEVGLGTKSEEHIDRWESSEEDKVQEVLNQSKTNQIDVCKTEVEGIVVAHLSVTSVEPESIPEGQSEDKITHNAEELNEKPVDEGIKVLPSSSKTEEQHDPSGSPERPTKLRESTVEDSQTTLGKSREVTEISDLTESRSNDGSQRESHHEEIKPKPSDISINGERRELQLIQDIKHTLSKDRLSTFSVDETLFGRSSYPLLAAATTESGH